MAHSRASDASSSLVINSLLGGTHWADDPTWALLSEAPEAGYADVGVVAAPSPLLGAAVAAVIAEVERLTPLSLAQMTGRQAQTADLRVFSAAVLPVGGSLVSLGGYAFSPGDGAAAGDVWLGPDLVGVMAPGGYGYRTVLHEIGHALGLKHPHERGPFAKLPPEMDNAEVSVMSARAYPGAAAGGLGIEPGGYARSFMPYDIAALQHLYGANYDAPRNDRYRFDPGERVLQFTIWDSGGHDVYDFGAYGTDLRIDLTPGASSATGQEAHLNWAETLSKDAWPIFAEGAIHNAYLHEGDWRSGIEDAIGGSGDDTIVGNALRNRLEGRAGDDSLLGGDGRDVLHGAGGDDSLFGGTGGDTLVGAGGRDRLSGDAGRDRLDGGAGADLLDGAAGRDRLDGGDGADTVRGGAGPDLIEGGAGADRLLGGPGTDRLSGGEGNDRLFGGPEGDWLGGGAGADRLFGEAGDDRLLAGPGDDRLRGVDGDDRLFGHAGSDWLHGGAGVDRLFGGSGQDVLLGGSGADTLHGGAGPDRLSGGAGADCLLGEAGDDTLDGGAGADVFVLDGRGRDTVLDFVPGIDCLDVADADAALASAVRDGADTLLLVDDGGTLARLLGVDPALLSPIDFL